MRPRSTRRSASPPTIAKALAVALVLVVAVVLVFTASPEDVEDTGLVSAAGAAGDAVDRLGERGTATGEGLTRVELTAPPGLIATGDGGSAIPTGTVDGPGRRIFGGITIRLPAGGPRLALRQIDPTDLGADEVRGAFVGWDGWVAVLTKQQANARTLPTRLTWRKAEAERGGVTVPAGATVRLRTMFRIPASAGRCTGRRVPADGAGRRAVQTLEGAPAWMVRRAGTRDPWTWLRVNASSQATLSDVVRSGPTKAVVFRGSQNCVDPQSSVTTEADPVLGADTDASGGRGELPADVPD